MNSKSCSKCKRILSLASFFRDPHQKSGYYPSCKDCYRERLGMKKRKKDWGMWHEDNKGYVALGRIREHRRLMEIVLKRKLHSSEIVHHKNGVKTDNRIENLEVMDKRLHHKLHYKELLVGQDGKIIKKK